MRNRNGSASYQTFQREILRRLPIIQPPATLSDDDRLGLVCIDFNSQANG